VTMPKKTPAQKAAAAAERERRRKERELAKQRKAAEEAGEVVPNLPEAVEVEEESAAKKRHASKFDVLQHCTITGVLSSRPDSRDVQIDHLSLTLYGKELISDTQLHVRHSQ